MRFVKQFEENRMPPPRRTITVFKLVRMDKQGRIYPLFIGKKEPIPMGIWIPAEFIPTKGFAHRPGWHAGTLPIAEHLMKKTGEYAPNRVWTICEAPADVDWQPVADQSRTRDIRDQVPEGGYYRFPRPAHQGGEWIISGAIKIDRILSWEEVDEILERGRA